MIDTYLPTFDVTTIHHTVVEATPEETYAAVRRIDFARSPVIRALTWAQMLPDRIAARLRGEHSPAAEQPSFTLDDLLATDFWVLLGEEPGVEIAFGLVGKFWELASKPVRVEPTEFAAFDEPGYAKVAWNYSVRAYGAGRSLLTTEARTATTDAVARARFRRWWIIIGPGAALVHRAALALIKADAEAKSPTLPKATHTPEIRSGP